jgi:hypothetical protein
MTSPEQLALFSNISAGRLGRGLHTCTVLVTKMRLERELWSTQLPVQRAASLVGRVSCRVFSCGNRRARDRNNFNTLMIKLLRFCFFLSLLATMRFSRSLSGRRLFGLLVFRKHAVPKWPAFPQKSQSTDDFSLLFKTKATARAMSLLSTSSSDGLGLFPRPEARK